MSNDEEAILPSLLKDIDRMLGTTDALRETLLRVRKTLSNDHDPHFYTKDVSDLIQFGSSMEFQACGFSRHLDQVKRPDKRRSKHNKKL